MGQISIKENPTGFEIAPSKTKLRILQVTDMHFGHFDGRNNQILHHLKKLIDQYDVDFVINTGDLFGKVPFQFYIRKVCRDFDRILNIPWTFAWGNHDQENFRVNKWFNRLDNIEKLLQNLPNCYYKQSRLFFEEYGESDIEEFLQILKNNSENLSKSELYKKWDGFYGGNNKIQILNPETKKPVWNLFILNSRRNYSIPPKVLQWMEDEIQKEASQIPALAFYHVPNIEYDKIWNKGALGIKFERVCFENDQGNTHQAFKKMGTLQGCFVGHDHVNDYSGEFEGINYVYGRKTGVYGYGGVKRTNFKENAGNNKKAITWGAKLITLNLNAPKPMNNTWEHITILNDGSTWVPDGSYNLPQVP